VLCCVVVFLPPQPSFHILSLFFRLTEFINELKSSENRSTLGEALMGILEKKIDEKQKRILRYPPVPHSLKHVSHSPHFLLSFDSLTIASQLTLLDFELFRNIEASELLEVLLFSLLLLSFLSLLLSSPPLLLPYFASTFLSLLSLSLSHPLIACWRL